MSRKDDMSEDKPETVMIEVSVDADKFEVYAAYRKALDARRSKYEQWALDMRSGSGPHYWLPGKQDCDAMRLRASSLLLLDALVGEWKDDREHQRPPSHDTELAIQAATPPHVAAEILGES